MTDNKELNLFSNITSVKGIGPKKAEAFKRLGVSGLFDILEVYPRSYEDFRNVKSISEVSDGEKVLIEAVVLLINYGRGFGRKRTLHILVEDKTGRMDVIFFMAGYMGKSFKSGTVYRFFGKVKVDNGRVTMFHPSYSLKEDSINGILPVYPLTKGLTQKDIRSLSKTAISYIDQLHESLPDSVIESNNLCSNAYAISNIHYPNDEIKFKEARYRLIFEELFYLQTALALSKTRKASNVSGISFNIEMAKDFIESLPFGLTKSQNNALQDILTDLSKPKTMNRLLQGDVGSGKTIIAEIALFIAAKNAYQAAFMAPTDILAHQHYETLKRDFKCFNLNIALLTSSLSTKEKRTILENLSNGSIDIIVGTHALISESVKYKKLGLVITDEQHRFGVIQRQRLQDKGYLPDVLVMTATPIPRTLALVLYADLDISIIDELPPGRIPIITNSYTEDNRSLAYKTLLNEVKNGRQAYIVAPFIEDSDSINGHSAEDLYDKFSKSYPDINCALLHGELKQQEKDLIMNDFFSGKISVLISTVVIEVGINVPNASVMLIENSERFGLAQLHQLRGRVGRGKYQSYCLIVNGDESEISKERAKIMCDTSNGFIIAEKDLELRGPGEFFGYRQHGLPQLQIADPIKHTSIAQKAAKAASDLLNNDPELILTENSYFAQRLKSKYLQTDNLTI